MPNLKPGRWLINYLLVGTMSINVLATGLPALLDQYGQQQARIPKPIAAQTDAIGAPAADAVKPTDAKAEKLPAEVQERMAADVKRMEEGKPRDPRHVKTLAEGRDANTKTFQNADGTKSIEKSLMPSSYQEGGEWKDIDPSLEQDKATGEWRSKANSWRAGFSDDALVRLTKAAATVSMVPVGAQVGSEKIKPVITGEAPRQEVTYRNVWQGIDVKYAVVGAAVKETIIVKSRAAQNTFSFDVSGVNLSPDPKKPGSFRLDGEFSDFFVSVPTVATQLEGVVGKEPYVKQTLEGNRLTLQLDRDWMSKQPTDAFPLVIDPTFTNHSNTFATSYRSDTMECQWYEGCGNSTGSVSNKYWRFVAYISYAGLENQILLSATLNTKMANCTDSSLGTCVGHSIVANRASCDGYHCIDTSYGSGSQWSTQQFNVDVTNLYRSLQATGSSTSWAEPIIVNGEEQGSNYYSYKSFDYSQTSVTFTFDTQPPVSALISPADNATVATTQPSLKSTGVGDAQSDPVVYRYILSTTKDDSGAFMNSGWTTTPAWTPPDSLLKDGTTYYWKSQTWDNVAGVPPLSSAYRSFRVDLRTGKDSTQAYDAVGPVSVDLATGNLSASATSHSIAALGGSLGVGLEYNSPQQSRPGLIGQYWNDISATRVFPGSAPLVTRVDPNIDASWGTNSSPATGIINNDDFLARWSGYFVAPKTGTYQFGSTSDDGSRIYINGSLNFNSWTVSPINGYGTNVALTAGQIVPIKYEYYDAGGQGLATLLVRTTDGTTVPATTVPTDWLQTGVRPVAIPHGLTGRYYTDDGSHNFPSTIDDPARIFLTRLDAASSLSWGTGAPAPNAPKDNFMVKWTGFFTPTVTDDYTFGVGADDGFKLTVGTGTPQTINAWTDHGASPIVYASSAKSFTAGVPVPITIEYYDHTGGAEMALYIKRTNLTQYVDTLVDPNLLSPNAQLLPAGWNLGLDGDGNLGYDSAIINPTSVVLRDASGQSHEYKFVSGGFTPPVNESGQMVRNGDGTITLQDSDGRTYVFNSDGTLKYSSSPADDLHPAALKYTYGGSPAHLTEVTDAVNTARWAKVHYWGDSGFTCPTASSFNSSPTTGFVCQIETSNGEVTNFLYNSDNRLARLVHPGSEMSDYGYLAEDGSNSCGGCLSSMRDSLANDAITAGVRTDDTTLYTAITYDLLGRASTVTMPAATVGATRQGRSYDYQPAIGTAKPYTLAHVSGATEPSGYTRKVAYDDTFRTLSDFDVAGLETATVWDTDPTTGLTRKDLVLSTTDPAGLKSTTIYDEDDRPTHQYGPAPTAWYSSTTRLPLTTPTDYTPQIPHNQTGYDESIVGLAAAYYDVTTASNGTGTTTKLLFGSPRTHQTGVGPSSGDVVKNWGATQPITPTVNTYGWGLRLSGAIKLPETGNHTFRLDSDDGARLWVDDKLIIDDWTDTPSAAYRTHPTNTVENGIVANATANSWHRIRIDYYNKAVSTTLDTDGHLELYKTAPGGSATTVVGSLLTPRYGLATSQKTYDSSSSVGDVTTTTSYGSNPELGLANSSNLDSAGLNYTTSSAYEAPGSTSFLRQTSKTLPGGTVTGYSYYTATDTKDNPCTTGTTEAYKQAGMLKTKTEADPDNNSGTTTPGVNAPRTTETIYDDAGRVVATRYNADSWTCTTYDSRGRVTTVAIPAFGSAPARTVTNVWAVSSNPLVVSSADAQGTITTTSDLLGRTTSYIDAQAQTTTTTYDAPGRMSTRSGPLGSEEFVYNDYNRLTSQKLDSVVQATPSYDSYGRLASVAYPTAGSLGQALTRDSLGRTTGTSYTLGNGSTGPSDAVTRSQSGQIVSGTELGQAKTYTYDKAGRLTAATIGSHTYAYSFGTPTGCTGTYNANSGKNSNRSSQTIDSVTTSFCYDYADRLVSSSDTSVTSPTYDAHGNTTQLGSGTTTAFAYDSSDRNSSITEGIKSTTFTRDVQNRIIKRTVSAPVTGLPTPWLTQDIGAPSLTGSATYSGSTFTLKGAGTDVWEDEDQSRYAYQTLTGNGQIIARLTSQSNTGEWAKAGITIKDSTTAHSNYVSVHATPSHGVRMQWNYEDDVDGGSYTAGNTWLKLTRAGDLVHTYKSSNGTSWTEVDVVEISLPNTATVGLYVSSLSPTTLGTATFDNVSVTQTGSNLPAGWATGNVGDPDTYGSSSYSGSTFTIAGAGIDVWEGDDQFRYVYQSLSGNGQIIARIKSQTNTGTWAKAGVVIKESPAAHTPYASIHTTPGADMRMQWNYEDDVDAGSFTFPNAWVKLVRSGNTVTTYKSSNGTTWTAVDSATIALPEAVSIGLFVSSTNPNAASTATFDNVSVTTNATSTDYKYGFTGSGDTPDLLLNSTGTVLEKYFQLPGGVLLTKRASSSVFSLVNIHDDIMATTDAAGAQTGTFEYDPFGNKISSTYPDNTTGGSSYGWVGQHEKDTETNFAIQPTEMGARVYLTKTGRFLSVDPVEGGVQNNYVYPPDPVNDEDISGMCPMCLAIIPALPAIGTAFTNSAPYIARYAPTIQRAASYISRNLNGGKTRVTISGANKITKYDLVGKSHYVKSIRKYIPTPHQQIIRMTPRGPIAGPVTRMTWRSLFTVYKYLKRK